MKFISNPPDASSLMTSARSFGNYDLPSALADLIDNSIKAKARLIRLSCLYNGGDPIVRILDDGYGMTQSELHAAMRPASSNPTTERSPDDLGRFGWGMKSASFSQCKKLTVMSRRAGELSGAAWDLDDVDNWKMAVLSEGDMRSIASPELFKRDGTEILWSKCDRLSEKSTIHQKQFNDLIVYCRNSIALIYHKYLSGSVRGRPLRIELNEQEIRPYDPFYSNHDATQTLEREEVRVQNSRIHIQPYVLPHYSKITLPEYDRLGGEDGFLKNQGFYVYRNHRLIISGTWFRLAKYGELSQLVRIDVEIPNSLDEIWKITIDKSDVQLPAVLRNRLKQIVDGLRKRSARTYRSKGGQLDRDENTVWQRHARHGEIRYSINRDHPIVAASLSVDNDEQKRAVSTALTAIEQSFPVGTFGTDASSRLDDIHQTETSPYEFQQQVEAALPALLADVDGDFVRLAELMRRTEPFSRNWKLTEDILREKGWYRAEA